MDITLADLKSLIGGRENSCSFQVGEKYLIRSVTSYYTGRLKYITDTDLVLEDAAWIAETGRFYDCLETGVLDEIEPFIHDVIVPRGSIVDATVWSHKLPREQK